MKGAVLFGYEFLTVLCPALMLMLAFRRRSGEKPRFFFCLLVFSVYLFGVFHVTGSGTVFDLRLYGWEFRAQEVNLLPFSDPQADLISYLLNVLLFMPLGVLLPFLWDRFSRLLPTLGCGFFLSVLVESSQLLNHRRTDVDDLILNTIGAALGLLVFRLFCRGKKQPSADSRLWTAPVCILALFLFRFFTFNEFGAARLLYGF